MMLEHILTNPDIFQRNYNIKKMAVYATPDSVVTSHKPGEVYTAEDKYKLNKLPPNARDNAHENLLTGQYIDKVYQEFINSAEGKEFINYLKKNGNGKSNPGKLEEIIVTNQGEGLVAATVPDYVKANIIINADYIDTYCSQMALLSGLSYDDLLKNVLVHEMNHYFGQTKKEQQGSELDVEFNNDSALIEFYMLMANKYPEDAQKYITKATVFTERPIYEGKYKAAMDKYINDHMPKVLSESSRSELSELEELSLMLNSYHRAA